MTMPPQPLLLVGASAWAGTLAAWAASAAGLPALPAVGAVVPGTAVVALLASRAGMLRPVRTAAILGLVGLLAGWVGGVGHLTATRPPAVQQWARAGVDVEVAGVVVSAKVVHRAQQGGRDYARAVLNVRSIGPPGLQRAIRSSAVAIADPAALSGLQRGSRLVVRGQLLPLQPWREPGIAIAVDDVGAMAPPEGFHGRVARARADMWRSLDTIDTDAAALVAGLAIGDDSRQSPQLAEAMRTSGLSHLTAVSGGNVAIVAGLVLGTAALAGAGLRLRIAAAVAAVVGYAAFVGPEPSVLRATVMGAVALVGLLRSSASGGFPLLGLALLVLVLVRPGLAISWGFALSAAATAGILAIAPRLRAAFGDRASPLPAAAIAAFAVTMAAQIATAPLIAAMTGTVSLVAVPANLLAAPLVAPITVLGLLLVVAASVSPAAAWVVAHLVEPFGALLARIAGWAAAVPHGNLAVPAGAAGAFAVMAVLAAACMLWLAASRRAPASHRRRGGMP